MALVLIIRPRGCSRSQVARSDKRDPTLALLLAALAVLLAIGPFLPQWALSFVSVALYLGIVVLGMALMMRTGLVSFGRGYCCLGAYGPARWVISTSCPTCC